MTTLFIADLHIDPGRPQITELFLRFLRHDAVAADALYILGDLFEAWVGDDDYSELANQVASALHALARTVPVYFMHGNRDFLLGAAYAERAGMTLLSDPTIIDLYGERTLIMHGDLLCTDDTAYQAFRTQTRDPKWQTEFLSQPLSVRREFAAQARLASAQHQSSMNNMETITDVTLTAVDDALATTGVKRLIHGHTHRPNIHKLSNGSTRIVVGDWYTQGSVLIVTQTGAELQTL